MQYINWLPSNFPLFVVYKRNKLIDNSKCFYENRLTWELDWIDFKVCRPHPVLTNWNATSAASNSTHSHSVA